MADYIYLLQNRLSPPQQTALQAIRDVAKAHGLTVFLVGGAVRDLTSGSPVRDLDVVVQGNALTLKKDIGLTGAISSGEVASWQAFFVRFPGGVRVEIGSTVSVTYPKPGKPVSQPATILDDLRRRDFTVNAMALSLNDGSYGLLMDPLNGVADIENRQLRLVSNYGFIEDPVRMIRAARFAARLGWTMDEKTQQRYDNGKAEKYIGALSGVHRGYETEEIFHEEDPLRVLRRLEEDGWMKDLFPSITLAKANVSELERLRDVQTQLQVSGINPDAAAAIFPLLTARLSAGEVAELKKSFVRPGFVREVENLEAEAKEFAAQLAGKNAALPSQAWKLIHEAKSEAVLWAAYSSKSAAVQAKLKSFHSEWPKARQKVPFALMQEMRIVPELDTFNEVVEKIFFELMDGNLTTPEEQKAFLEPFSPPAPPPPVRLSRSRAGKKDNKSAKGKKKATAAMGGDEDDDLDRDARDPEYDGDEEHEEAASIPDDENEDAPVVLVTEQPEEAVERSAFEPAAPPKPPAVPEPEPVRVPESLPVMMPEPAPTASKPKRIRSTPDKTAAPIQVEPPPPSKPIAPPHTPAIAKATSMKTPVLSPLEVIPAPVITKRQAKPTSPAVSKAQAGAVKIPATPSASKPSVKAAKAVAKPLPQAKNASVKQAPIPAKKAVPTKTAPSAKVNARKLPAAPVPLKTIAKDKH